jgi:hypothetical protein
MVRPLPNWRSFFAERVALVSTMVVAAVVGRIAPKSPLAQSGQSTAAAQANPSTEETMSQQLGARRDDRDQHQLLECLRCNFIAHMLSDVHAQHDRQHRSR